MSRRRRRESRSHTRGRSRRRTSRRSTDRTADDRAEAAAVAALSPVQRQATLKKFLELHAPDDEEVRESTVQKLIEKGIETDWQLEAAPLELLLQALPPETCSKELTFAVHAQKTASRRYDASSTLATQVGRLGKVVKKGARRSRRGRSRSPSSESLSSDSDVFNAAEALKRYGLPTVPHHHMVGVRDLRPWVRAAKRAAKKGEPTLLGGNIAKWAPQWLPDKYKPKNPSDQSHAFWTACWWSRALSQLTLQAATGKEVLPVEALLTEFLDANRIAIEDTCRAAFEYDSDLWADTTERLRRRDPGCTPASTFSRFDENRRTRARARAAASAVKGSNSFAKGSSSFARGLSKGAGRKASGSAPPPPPPLSRTLQQGRPNQPWRK